jgi:hypothetical protein
MSDQPQSEEAHYRKSDLELVNAILAMSAVSQSMGVDDLLRFGIETSYAALERRLNVAGLGAEAERVAERMRGEATGDVAHRHAVPTQEAS